MDYTGAAQAVEASASPVLFSMLLPLLVLVAGLAGMTLFFRKRRAGAGPQSAPAKKKPDRRQAILILVALALLIGLYIAGYAMYGYKGFEKLQTVLDVFRQNAALICIVCGVTCVMLTGGVDLSVGGLVALDCMILAVGMEKSGLSPSLLVPLVLAVGVIFGLMQGFCVGYLDLHPGIVTAAGMFIARSLTAVISTDPVMIRTQTWFRDAATAKIYMPFEWGAAVNSRGVKMVPYVGWPVIIALALLVLVSLLLRFTRLGRGMYVVGGSKQSAALMGLNVKRTKMVAYVLSSFLCSIGGILYCMNTMTGAPTQAMYLETRAFSSAVVGGVLATGGAGSVWGAFIGVLVNGLIQTLVSYSADLARLGGAIPNLAAVELAAVFIALQSFLTWRQGKKAPTEPANAAEPAPQTGADGAPLGDAPDPPEARENASAAKTAADLAAPPLPPLKDAQVPKQKEKETVFGEAASADSVPPFSITMSFDEAAAAARKRNALDQAKTAKMVLTEAEA